MFGKAVLILSALTTSGSVAAHAQDLVHVPRDNQVGLVRAVELLVQDSVTGGCWTNIDAVSNKIRLEFESRDFPVYQEPLRFNFVFFPRLVISVSGERTDAGLCFGRYDFQLLHFANSNWGGSEVIPTTYELRTLGVLWGTGGSFVAPHNFNEMMLENVDNLISGLLADIYSARRDPTIAQMLGDFREMNAITAVEWNEILELMESR